MVASEILYLAASNMPDATIKTKDLHLSLGYSEARTSEVLRELVADGWLVSVPCEHDRRVRRLRATSRTFEALRELFDSGVFDWLRNGGIGVESKQ